MTYKDALKLARTVLIERDRSDEVENLDTKRQKRKFKNGHGRVRQLAGLPHSRAARCSK